MTDDELLRRLHLEVIEVGGHLFQVAESLHVAEKRIGRLLTLLNKARFHPEHLDHTAEQFDHADADAAAACTNTVLE